MRLNRAFASTITATLFSTASVAQMPPPVVTLPAAGGERLTTDGFLGNWYPGTGAQRRPAILLLGGSEGGIGPGAARQAASFSAQGYAVLQLAYFGAPGLPAKLNMVPLEYFDRALAWLRHQPTVGRIGIVGGSKGAEAALLVAARNPDIRAVVVGAPSIAVWPGIDTTGGPVQSSWSVKGQPVEYLAYGADATTMLAAYSDGLKKLTTHPGAAIPVERIKAKAMFVCGKADTLWPSCPMSDIAAERMAGKATVLAYDDAGHAAFGPPVDASSPSFASLGSLGGSPAGNEAAREDAWPKVLGFLAANLRR